MEDLVTDGFKEVHFHLLDANGAKVQETIKLNKFNRKVELDEWFAVEGRAHLVQRISFDSERLDIFLKPLDSKTLN